MGDAILQNIIEVLQFCHQEKCLFFLVISTTRVSLHLGVRVGYSEIQFKTRSNSGQKAHNKGKDVVDFSALAHKFRIRIEHRATSADAICAETFALIEITLKPKTKQTKWVFMFC